MNVPDRSDHTLQRMAQLRHLEAERAVLGRLLQDPTMFPRVRQLVAPTEFADKANQLIYQAMDEIVQSGNMPDLISTRAKLKEQGDLDQVGGTSYISDCIIEAVSPLFLEQSCELIYEAHYKRQALRQGLMIDKAIADGQSAAEVANKVRANFEEIGISRRSKKPSRISDLLEMAETELSYRHDNPEEAGLRTRFGELDTLIGGLAKGSFNILGARPSMGKTMLGLNIAQNIARGAKDLPGTGKPVVIFSIEMPRLDVVFRMLSREGEIDHGRIRSGQLTDTEFNKWYQAIAQMNEYPIHIFDASSKILTVQAIKSYTESLEEQPALILIDYIQIMEVPPSARGKGADEYGDISQISKGLKQYAAESGVPILALSQLSRSVESRNNKRPMLSDLRASGNIEQDADTAMFIYRDGYYNKESEDKDLAEIIVAKNRHGETGMVPLLYRPQYQSFWDTSDRPKSVPQQEGSRYGYRKRRQAPHKQQTDS